MRAESLRILQWNVWYREDIHRVAEYILNLPETDKPHIIGGQEFTKHYGGPAGIDTTAVLAAELGYHYCEDVVPVNALSRLPEDGWEQGIAILCQDPIIAARADKIHTPLDVDSPFDQYRSLLEADVRTKFGDLTFATLHASTTSVYREQAMLDEEYNRIFKHTSGRHDFVAIGDLNGGSDSPVVTGITKDLIYAGPDPTEGSWPTIQCLEAGIPVQKYAKRYDHAFYSADLADRFVVNARFLDMPAGQVVSDHRPLLIELTPKVTPHQVALAA